MQCVCVCMSVHVCYMQSVLAKLRHTNCNCNRQSTVRGHKCHNPFIIATSSWNANRKTKGFRSRIKNLGKTTRRIKQMRRISILWALRRGGEGTLLRSGSRGQRQKKTRARGKRSCWCCRCCVRCCFAAFDSLQTASNSTRSTRARSKLNEQDTTRQDLQGRWQGQGELLLLFVCAHWACRSAAPDRQSL